MEKYIKFLIYIKFLKFLIYIKILIYIDIRTNYYPHIKYHIGFSQVVK